MMQLNIMLINDDGEGYIVREHGFAERMGKEKIQALRPLVMSVPHLRKIVEYSPAGHRAGYSR